METGPTVQVLIKLPEDIAQALEAEAKRERRSKTAQVALILEQRYAQQAEPERQESRVA